MNPTLHQAWILCPALGQLGRGPHLLLLFIAQARLLKLLLRFHFGASKFLAYAESVLSWTLVGRTIGLYKFWHDGG